MTLVVEAGSEEADEPDTVQLGGTTERHSEDDALEGELRIVLTLQT
jgi:hypothetical protein